MDTELILISVSQVLILGGFFFWLVKKNTTKIDQILIDVAVMKNSLKHTSTDHDRIIVLESKQKETDRELCIINRCLTPEN